MSAPPTQLPLRLYDVTTYVRRYADGRAWVVAIAHVDGRRMRTADVSGAEGESEESVCARAVREATGGER